MARKNLFQRRAASAAKAADKGAATHDSFQNFLTRTGIGTDNVSSASHYGFNPISRNRIQLEWMYRGSWIVGQVVDCIADDMTRAGAEVASDDMDPGQIDALHEAMQHLQVWERVNDTIKWSRLYGGAIAVLLIDGQDPKTPLRIDTVSKGQFRGLLVLDRWMVQPSLNNLVTAYGPELGLPKFYDVVAGAPALPEMRVHHTRCIRIDGVDLPYFQKITENLWGMSVVERLFDRLVAFDSTSQGAAQLVYKAHLRTYSIEGLRELIAAGGKMYEAVLQQIDMIRRLQVNEGLTLMDAKDKFEAHQYTFAGLDAVLLQFGQQLSGASGIPLVRLFGQSPAGLNSTGESDLRNYYDGINQQQNRRLRAPFDKLYRVTARSEGIVIPQGFGFKFNPLWQLSDSEKSEIAEKTGRAVGDAFDRGIFGRRTALAELRQSSRVTGIFSNITDEEINAADDDPPAPNENDGGDGPGPDDDKEANNDVDAGDQPDA